ncbi:MAG: cupin [endosymbiont of Galathealinum brachiosum]|uniref:Cupin n=1 Tax=endosymbiont of Galathealinum brachiosum TaxID=2200906 RepID=A0A370DME3_9GAMM|nr:MAG: cupin [endosymbiont of Galathealinum brachiosum]
MIKKTDENNLFSEVPDSLDKELIEVLLSSENIKVERIVSKGHISPETGWYDQDLNEWVVVIKGEAIIAFENREVSLKEGSYINIPAHTKHKVSWTHPQLETIWLAIHY